MWEQGLYCQPSACVTDTYAAFIQWLSTYRTVSLMLTLTKSSQWPPTYRTTSPMHVHACVHKISLGFTFYT